MLQFKREIGLGDIIGAVGFLLAGASFVVALRADHKADTAAAAQAKPSVWMSSVTTVGGERTDSSGIERESRTL